MAESLIGMAAEAFEAQRRLQEAVRGAITQTLEGRFLGTFIVSDTQSQLRDEMAMILEAVKNDPRVLEARLHWMATRREVHIYFYVDYSGPTHALTFYYKEN
jgi:hypothetical protein